MAEKEKAEVKETKPKKQKLTPEEKKEKKEKHKNKVEVPSSIATSITAEKQVKHELKLRKVAKIAGVVIAISLIITSIVYIAIINIQPNNIKIITTTDILGQTLKVSFGNNDWASTLYIDGPDDMLDISYNPFYKTEHVYTIEEVRDLLIYENPELGIYSGKSFIAGLYAVKNDTDSTQYVRSRMALEFNKKRLHEACRVLVGTSRRSTDSINAEYVPTYNEDGTMVAKDDDEIIDLCKKYNTGVDVYAALSYNERLEGSAINSINNRTLETGFLEYIAYPIATADGYKTIQEIDSTTTEKDRLNGYKTTVAFEDDEFIYSKYEKLEPNEYLYVFIEVWFEGSDFECVDEKLGGYVKLEIDNKIVNESTYSIKNMNLLKEKIDSIMSRYSVQRYEGEEYLVSSPLLIYNINTLYDKQDLIEYLCGEDGRISSWTLNVTEEKKAEADNFLSLCNTLSDIADYLTKYAQINNYTTIL